MSLSLYMDAQVRSGVTRGLRLRGVAVLTAQEDGTDAIDDPDLLDRAMALGYVVFTQDIDFLIEAARRQRMGQAFAGVVYGHQQNVSTGQCVQDLELMAKVYDPVDMMNRVEYLPL
jgi:predicted nuclease of predicted toxin-antitoxin system